MKKHFFKLLLIAILVLIPFGLVKAETLSKKLSGKILLQVESHGEAWYVNPSDANRYYMADGSAAYDVMRNFGVGITNNNLTKFQNNKNLAKKQSGKIFLQVEDRGQAYYINSDGTLHYLKNGDAAYEIMRSLGLGISNTNLSKISEATSSPSQISQDNQESQYTIPQTTATTTLTCSVNWQCGTWSSCANSQQKRFCNDLNNCNIENLKPATTQSCTTTVLSCQADTWSCDDWNLCSASGNQTRSCIKTFDCSSVETPSPLRTQNCTPAVTTQQITTLSISTAYTFTTNNSAQISWDTNIPSSAKVFLTMEDGSIKTILFAAVQTQHIVDIPNLKSNTQYPYTIEATSGTQVKTITGTTKTKWEDPYSDYVFINASPTVGEASQWQIWFSVASTERDIRVKKAVFKISDENATKFDNILNRGDGSSLSFMLRHPTKNVVLPLSRTDKNTFIYESTSGISIGQPNYPLSLIFTVVADQNSNYRLSEENRALMENITVPMSEWVIWDNTTGKQIKTW